MDIETAIRMVHRKPMHPTLPVYPFQCIFANHSHFTNKGHYYLVMIDRYSNWPIVMIDHGEAQALISNLHRTFVTYGIPVELGIYNTQLSPELWCPPRFIIHLLPSQQHHSRDQCQNCETPLFHLWQHRTSWES